jgi:hypothetical protein
MANSYERIRQVVIDALENAREGQFDGLKEVVAATLAEQSGDASSQRAYVLSGARLSYEDSRLFTEVFWDLFREGMITLGLDADNPTFPWFRASRLFDVRVHGGEQGYS